MSHQIPAGFRMAGVYSGVKLYADKRDLTLVVCDQPTTAVGVYTQNVVCAAPVVLDRSRTPSASIRAVVINSGNANACTGERGMEDALAMTRLTAAAGSEPSNPLGDLATNLSGEPLSVQ